MTQNYHGEKIILAWEQEKNGIAGYAVKYEDGYVSWSPKEVFEAAYLPLGHIDGLPAFHQRLIAEKLRLDDRIAKLEAFLGNAEATAKVDQNQVALMTAQLPVMQQLASILAERVATLGQPDISREEAQKYTAEIDLKSSKINILGIAPEGVVGLTDSVGAILITDIKDPEGNSLKSSLKVDIKEPGERSFEREIHASFVAGAEGTDNSTYDIDLIINTQTAAVVLSTDLTAGGYKLVLEVHHVNMNRLSKASA
jgi:hypothetical protein